MDREARSNLRKVVAQTRQLLEKDVRIQLKRLGIEEGGKTVPAGRLTHLHREDKDLRDKILIAIQKEEVREVKRGEAYDRYVQHVGFTYLNRLAALRAMEVRGLIEETVIRRDQYAGMSKREYELSERDGLSDRGEIVRTSLLEAFSEVSQEIKVLFDVSDEYSLLFPGYRTLDGIMKLFGEEVPEEDWREEEIIGWIYQYYNSEARSEFRRKRRTPRPDDIPVINQFYTPRWLVRALVDNTLGHLWLEMKGRMPKPGETKAPNEETLKNPQGETVDEYCSYLIPMRQDHHPREEKSVREIKVLDPACGSGHFLIYAFNVLYKMYLEDEPETSREEIPRLILENNLFGIDIDLRSVQLSALSLFLKAKEYNQDSKIGRMNLVCADVRITDGDLQKKFISRLEHDVDLQRIFAKLLKEFEYTYDVGSLLKVRAPFERLLEKRKKGVQTKFLPRIIGQSSLSKKGGVGGQSELLIKEFQKGVLVKPAVTLEEMLNALLEFEREGMEKKDMGTMLFAGEAEKSVGLLSLLGQTYDVIVMNPPYGDMPKTAKEYAKEHYPKTHFDYYAAFIEQTVDLVSEGGYIGALTGRTFMFLKSYKWVREKLLRDNSQLQICFDLGFGVLDEATARWAAFTARKSPRNEKSNATRQIVFLGLTEFQDEDRRIQVLNRALQASRSNLPDPVVFEVSLQDIDMIPGSSYSYWISQSIRQMFTCYPPLDRDLAKRQSATKVAAVKFGLSTGDNSRFTRFYWEVDPNKIGKDKKWVPYARGGSSFYCDINSVVNWEHNGTEIKNFPVSYVRNEKFYFRSGLSWPLIASSDRLIMRILPPNVIFDQSACALFPKKASWIFPLLTWGNSSIVSFLLLAIEPLLHNRPPGTVSRLPIPQTVISSEKLKNFGKKAFNLLREWDTGNEVSTLFIKPWLLQTLHVFDPSEKPITHHPLAREFEWADLEILKKIRNKQGSPNMSIRELAEICVQREKIIRNSLCELQELIDHTVYNAFGISEGDRKIIDEKLKETYEEIVEPQIPVEEHVARLISYYIKLVIESDLDGIVPLDEAIQKIRECLADDFGDKRSARVESEVTQILGKNLEEWLLQDFFNFHVGLYERRPIIWQITSMNVSPRRGSQGTFNCLLYYHRLRKDTIFKIRTRDEYLKGTLRGTEWKTQRLRRELQEARDLGDERRERQLQEEYEKSLDELNELQALDNKLAEVSNPRDEPTELDEDASWVEKRIAEVRDNGWNPVLEYGVRVNIEPLKEAGLLHRAAERVK